MAMNEAPPKNWTISQICKFIHQFLGNQRVFNLFPLLCETKTIRMLHNCDMLVYEWKSIFSPNFLWEGCVVEMDEAKLLNVVIDDVKRSTKTQRQWRWQQFCSSLHRQMGMHTRIQYIES